MPSDSFRADETALSSFATAPQLQERQPSSSSTALGGIKQREAMWLEWEQHFLTEIALRADASDGFQH
ncbi:hypothetical protein GCM10007301_29460 [Azorhizobium oxalatiphilum]|uniref:Uncharacterized protein n=1 Tax=Azorhizobium oxalatiphilum TaxID=980631 RepID=A0A917C381_9HYPH|nr:hypothetical protein GCM10007301_29460 [Azorhizobium oxalatiphilum]